MHEKNLKLYKKNVQSESLKDIVKDLQKSIFGNDDSNGESSIPPKRDVFDYLII